MAQTKKPRSSSDGNNIPGMSYLERMSARYLIALEGQSSQVNKLWRGLKSGDWSHKDLGKVFVASVESYYDLAVEALKGPNYVARPEWVYFCFRQSVRINPILEAEISIDVQPEDTELEQTDLVQVAGNKVLTARGPGTLYKTCMLTEDRKAVSISLDDKILQKATAGHYTGLISAKGRSGQPPLVIVTLIIE